jgi:hypothetical protein
MRPIVPLMLAGSVHVSVINLLPCSHALFTSWIKLPPVTSF